MNSTHIGHFTRSALICTATVLALAHAAFSFAQQPGRGTFDHLRTTFPLTGVHAVTPCENCHIAGQMAGTPRQCEYCHRAGSRIATTFKPARHIQTNEGCNVCHRSAATWTGARYNHAAAAPGTCLTCHNGAVAPGKPAKHVLTTSSCDQCHRTVAWIPSRGFNHALAGVVVGGGTCGTCHGVTATGKPSGHVVTTSSCDVCHKSTTAWLPASFDHTGVIAGTCANCHVQGGSGLPKPSNHIPYETQLLNGASLGCDACHRSTTTFTSEAMDHNNTQGNGSGFCRGCHATGTNYLGNMTRRSVTHQSKTATDCSQSGCHRPLGTQGSTYKSW